MKLTKQRVQWMAALSEQCFDMAEKFCEDTGNYPDLVLDRSEAAISFNDKGFMIEGQHFTTAGCGCCSDYENYYIDVPYGYIENPVGWLEEKEEREHQELLKKLHDKQVANLKEKNFIKREEERRLAELIDKHRELAEQLVKCEGI